MTNVQFYNTPGDLSEALLFTCRLAQKVHQRGLPILIQTPDEATGKSLDELLWSFEPTAFLPHSSGTDMQPINVGWQDDPGEHHSVLINLGTQIPSWHGRFEQVLEIIYDEGEVVESKRNSFRFYKERGYPLKYHDFANN